MAPEDEAFQLHAENAVLRKCISALEVQLAATLQRDAGLEARDDDPPPELFDLAGISTDSASDMLYQFLLKTSHMLDHYRLS